MLDEINQVVSSDIIVANDFYVVTFKGRRRQATIYPSLLLMNMRFRERVSPSCLV